MRKKDREAASSFITIFDTISFAYCVNSQVSCPGAHYRCLGSTQHLKSKYGSGYLLEIKLDQSSQHGGGGSAVGGATSDVAAAAKQRMLDYIKQLFPRAVESETFGDRSVFAVPRDDVTSLAHVFATLEKGKQNDAQLCSIVAMTCLCYRGR